MQNVKAFLKKYWIGVVAILLIIAVVLSSVEIYKEEVLNIDPDIEYVEKSALNFCAERIDTLNPLVSQSEDVYYISKLIYDPLFDFDENMGVTPCLVDSYTVNTEKASIKIKLKSGIKWHDGSKLTASDVKFTVDAIKQVGSKSPYYDKASKIMTIVANGNRELTIYFNNNYNCSLDVLTFPIVSDAGYSSAYNFAKDTENFKPIGTGMYQYQSYNYLKHLKLKPNKDYFGEVAEKKIKISIIPDSEKAEGLMEIEEVCCYIDRDTDRRAIVKDKNLTMYDITSNQVEFLVFNTKKAYWNKKDVRQAAAYAIDTEKILETSYASDAVACDTIYFPNFLGVEDTGTSYTFEPEKAEQMLSAAGLSDTNGDGYLEDPYGNTLTVTILAKKSNTQRVTAAKLIADDLQDVGLKCTVSQLSGSAYKSAMSSGKFDILIAGYEVEETFDLRELFNGKNAWGYYGYTLYDKARQLERLYDTDELKEKYQELKEALLDEMPYYALCYKKMGLIGASGFEAEKLPTFNNIYKNCNTWTWKVEKKTEESDSESE